MFKRGFKTWCEQTAEAIRRQRGMQPWEAVRARTLAESLKATMVTPEDLPALPSDVCRRLLSEHENIWSAITISTRPPLIVYNPAHSEGRQNSDLMHEIAHLLMEHVPGTIYIEVFGERGTHARTSHGGAEIPFGACVEVELIAEVIDLADERFDCRTGI